MLLALATFAAMQRAAAAGQTSAGAAGSQKPAAGSSAAGGAEVKIDNFTFTPETITVPAGTQVTWTNHDDIPHNIVSEDKSIKSKVLDTDEKFSFTFTSPGTYSYFCSIHPKMKGKVVVQ
jgi:amicyanin